MTKKKIAYFSDLAFWYIVYLLPIFALLVSSINSAEIINFADMFTVHGYNVLTENNIVYTSLVALFGDGGVLPLFGSDSGVIMFGTWFVCCTLLHLAVDFLLFIPRLAHKYMGTLTRTEE